MERNNIKETWSILNGTINRNYVERSDLPSVSSFMPTTSILFLKPTDKSIVLKCKRKNSLDSDNLSMYLIEQNITFIAKSLTHIFNMPF